MYGAYSRATCGAFAMVSDVAMSRNDGYVMSGVVRSTASMPRKEVCSNGQRQRVSRSRTRRRPHHTAAPPSTTGQSSASARGTRCRQVPTDHVLWCLAKQRLDRRCQCRTRRSSQTHRWPAAALPPERTVAGTLRRTRLMRNRRIQARRQRM